MPAQGRAQRRPGVKSRKWLALKGRNKLKDRLVE